VDGIPRFFHQEEYYWGEVGREQARLLLKAARETSWIEAVHEYYPSPSYILDIQRAAWLPLLGLEPNAVVLDVGSGYGAITHALAYSARAVASVEAIPERIEFTQERLKQESIHNVQLLQASATALPFAPQTFDMIVLNGILEWIGEWDLESDPRSAQLRFLSKIHDLLKDDGVVVIGIENRVAYHLLLGAPDHSNLPYTSLLPRRLATLYMRHSRKEHLRKMPDPKREYRTYTYTAAGYKRLLREARFSRVDLYWADPGYNRPHGLVPLSDPEAVKRRLFYVLTSQTWRGGIKRLAARFNLLSWFLPEFVILASKGASRDTGLQRWLREELEKELAGDLDRFTRPQEVVYSAVTRSHACSLPPRRGGAKSTLFFSQPKAASRRIIAKAETGRASQGGILQEEFENLTAVYERLQSRPGLSVSVPRPIADFRSDNAFYFLETQATGVQFCELVESPDYFRSLSTVESDYAQVVEATIDLHWALSGIRNASPIDPRWRELPDELSKEPEVRRQIERVQAQSKSLGIYRAPWTQHTDFTVENVFLDRQSGRVEVIDWAYLASGLPPMYDLFSFIVTSWYGDSSRAKREKLSEEKLWTSSFDDTFCSSEGVGSIFRELTVKACRKLEVPPAWIPILLVEGLIVCANCYLYRHFRNQAHIRLTLLRHVAEHLDRPVFGWPMLS
jgi:SAM-dependent methyltransferase